MSRCIGVSRQLIENDENERNMTVHNILENSKIMNNEIQSESYSYNEDNLIKHIINSIQELNNAFKEHSSELIHRSDFESNLKQSLEPGDNDNIELFEFIDHEIIDSELKRRLISDMKFTRSIKKFENSDVPYLLGSIYHEYPMIGQKYPFLFDIISVLNSNLFHIGKEKLVPLAPDEENLRYNLYSQLFAMANEEQSK